MSLERRPLYNPNLIVNEEPDVPRVVIPRASAVARGGYQQAPEVGNNPPLPNNGDNKFKRSKCHIIQASLTVILFVTTLAMIVSFGALSSHLLSAMNSMSERINSPGRLYESCHQETASCSFPPGGGLDYWMNCATSYLIINATVYNYRWILYSSYYVRMHTCMYIYMYYNNNNS